MTSNRKFKRVATRSSVGFVVTAAAAAGIFVATVAQPQYPLLTADPLPVDIASSANHTVACAGSLPLLGADLNNPSLAVPQGALQLQSYAGEAAQLRREAGDAAGSGTAFTAPADVELAAAGSQTLTAENAAGYIAVNCAAPSTEQWVVAGKTVLGSSATLSLANPGTKTATVQVTAYAANGKVQSGKTTGAVVPPGQVRTISVNGLAPEAGELALHVQSHGGAVTAQLGISEVHDIRTFGVDLVAAQAAPNTTLLFPGLRTTATQRGSDASSSSRNELFLFAPNNSGTAEIHALGDDGRKHITTVTLEAGKVANIELLDWPAGAALEVTSQVPVVGGASGTTLTSGKTDMAWYAPAPELTSAAVAVVQGGHLHLVNPGPTPAEVQLTPRDGRPQKITVAAGSQHTITAAPGLAQLTVSGPIHAGITIFNNDGTAAYPVVGSSTQKDQLLLFTD